MEKVEIRRQYLAERKRIDPLRHQQLSRQAQHSLICSDCFAQAEKLALYSPVNNEVATADIFAAALDKGKRVFYPQVCRDSLQFREVRALDELAPGAFGVLEPDSSGAVGIEELDLIVVPGVAFDLRGHRLGYGRGFYDRFLVAAMAENISVGLCFERQLCSELTEEVHDQKIMFLATETRFIPCHDSMAGSS